MKSYNYIPIVVSSEIPAIKNIGSNPGLSGMRHIQREKDAFTEFIAQISDVTDDIKVRELFLKFNIKLVEDAQSGSRVISASFPEKRFY